MHTNLTNKRLLTKAILVSAPTSAGSKLLQVLVGSLFDEETFHGMLCGMQEGRSVQADKKTCKGGLPRSPCVRTCAPQAPSASCRHGTLPVQQLEWHVWTSKVHPPQQGVSGHNVLLLGLGGWVNRLAAP
jgi:hypothetical protein